jgi:uncharacterized membrane protein|tara:strand:+ start:2959 stop:3225 length:267 start_codon:yes stop_codon:yes gene_type:complete
MVMSKLDINEDGVVDFKDVEHLLLRYEIIALGGALLIVLPVLNTLNYISVDSNFFWILCGLVMLTEGLVEIKHERKKMKPQKEEKINE